VSMVRSNNETDLEKAIGFVNIPRSCVALSRSKRKTIIVGDQSTLIKSKFFVTINRYYNNKRRILQDKCISLLAAIYCF
jgi:superfamily I DNA and/or RNA helicase